MKLWQMLVFTAVIFAFIYFEIETESYEDVVVAALTSWVFSIVPLKIYDWFIFRRISAKQFDDDRVSFYRFDDAPRPTLRKLK